MLSVSEHLHVKTPCTHQSATTSDTQPEMYIPHDRPLQSLTFLMNDGEKDACHHCSPIALWDETDK